MPESVKDERLQALLTLRREQTAEAMMRQIGRKLNVLVEKQSRNAGDMQGRTPDFKIVHFKGQARQTGQVMPMPLTEAYGQSLRGELILAGDSF